MWGPPPPKSARNGPSPGGVTPHASCPPPRRSLALWRKGGGAVGVGGEGDHRPATPGPLPPWVRWTIKGRVPVPPPTGHRRTQRGNAPVEAGPPSRRHARCREGGGGGGGWVGNGGRASGARPPPPARPACTTPPPCPSPAPPSCPSPRGRRQPPPRPPCLGCCLSSRLPAGHASWRPPPPPPTPTQRMQEGARRQWRGKREGATAREGARGGEHVSQKRPWWPRVSGASRGGPTQ